MKKLIVLLLTIYSLQSFAGSYTGKSQITWVSTIYGDYFAISGTWTNALGCTKTDGNIWKIYSENGSMEELKVMYSSALAAYMAGKTIELYAHECGADGRPHARSIYIPSRSGN